MALPDRLRQAVEQGDLTEDQLRELIALEADALGLSAEEAIARAKAGKLPRTYLGDDLALLIELLPSV